MAAYSRFASLSSNDDAPDGMADIPLSLVTPEESDQSELRECIMEGLESLVEDGGSGLLLESDCAAVSSNNRTDGHTTTIIADRWVDETKWYHEARCAIGDNLPMPILASIRNRKQQKCTRTKTPNKNEQQYPSRP